MSFMKGIFKKLSSWASYQGVIDTQINIYNKLKKRSPNMSENECLNYIITSRMKSTPKIGSVDDQQYQEYKYKQLIENNDKTLRDVIWEIVVYEFIQSRRVEIFSRGYKLGLSTEDIFKNISDLQDKIHRDVEESINKKVK